MGKFKPDYLCGHEKCMENTRGLVAEYNKVIDKVTAERDRLKGFATHKMECMHLKASIDIDGEFIPPKNPLCTCGLDDLPKTEGE